MLSLTHCFLVRWNPCLLCPLSPLSTRCPSEPRPQFCLESLATPVPSCLPPHNSCIVWLPLFCGSLKYLKTAIGVAPRVQGHLCLCIEVEASLGYVRHHPKTIKIKNKFMKWHIWLLQSRRGTFGCSSHAEAHLAAPVHFALGILI